MMLDRSSLRHVSLALCCALVACTAACSGNEPAKVVKKIPTDAPVFVPPDAEIADALDASDAATLPDNQGGDTDLTLDADDAVTNEVVAGCEVAGGFGCPCESNFECDSNYCVESPAGKVCTKTCTTTCAVGWKCLQASDTDPTFICLPANSTLCKPCKSHVECASTGQASGENLCVPFDQGNGFIAGYFCGAGCSDKTPCTAGYSCKEVQVPNRTALVKQCVPDSGDCTCTPVWAAQQISTACSRENAFGTCYMERTCTDQGLTLCNSPWPAAELCDQIDNNCNGETDEGDAVGCVVYYPDNDGDNVGQGLGKCQCGDPGPGWAILGGDCDDLNSSIKPGAIEICDNIDNNCNGSTDESGSKGCNVYYKDLDGDKFGDDTNSACLCKSKKTAEWMEMPGDCDDEDVKVHPGVDEVCNGKDDNCNGKSDEEGAEGCILYYVDVDKDTYGPAATGKCLCASNKIYAASEPGDCDDNNAKIHPNSVEICNNVDDDCNGLLDDGDTAAASCPDIPNATKGCNVGGTCGIAGCKKPLFDVNGDPKDGCECTADNNYGSHGMTCQNTIDLGQLSDGGGASVIKSGNVVPGEGGDWYSFIAYDSPDDNGACDQFDVRVKMTSNPGNQFAFDFYRGSCADVNKLCEGEVESEWTVSFYGQTPSGPAVGQGGNYGESEKSPYPEKGGECNCTHPPANTGEWGQKGPVGMNYCKNNTAPFLVHVYRKTGLPVTCDAYTITFVNAPKI